MVYLLSFFLYVLYNYYGDNMNSKDVIVNIKSMKDVDSVTNNTRYINFSIDNMEREVIDYFLLHGKNYSYSDAINDKNGFIYANYDMFYNGEIIVDKIIDNMPVNLNNIEKARYIYISLGRILSSDINSLEGKNETISFDRISTINNIWGALSKKLVSDVVIGKIFLYLCTRIGIKSELVSSNINGNVANKIYIDDSYIIVDLFNDLYNIQGNFITNYFDKYNDNKDIDKKIGYIKDDYMDRYIDDVMKNIDYGSNSVMYDILFSTSRVIDVNNIGVCELYKIYRAIFDKYIPNSDVKINNLFVYNGLGVREHFIIFNYDNVYYGYNYNKRCFMNVDYNILCDNINNNKIGIYDGEDFIVGKGSVML